MLHVLPVPRHALLLLLLLHQSPPFRVSAVALEAQGALPLHHHSDHDVLLLLTYNKCGPFCVYGQMIQVASLCITLLIYQDCICRDILQIFYWLVLKLSHVVLLSTKYAQCCHQNIEFASKQAWVGMRSAATICQTCFLLLYVQHFEVLHHSSTDPFVRLSVAVGPAFNKTLLEPQSSLSVCYQRTLTLTLTDPTQKRHAEFDRSKNFNELVSLLHY
jgi:hypothetical protein